MLSFLILILVLLLWSAVAILLLMAIQFFFEKIFGFPIPARVMQLLYVIVALLFLIWLAQSISGTAVIPMPPAPSLRR